MLEQLSLVTDDEGCGTNAKRAPLLASTARSALVAQPQAEKAHTLPPLILGCAAAANAASEAPPAAASPYPPPPRGRLQLRPHRCGGRRLLRVLRRARRRALQLRPRGADAGAPPRRAQRGRVRDVGRHDELLYIIR